MIFRSVCAHCMSAVIVVAVISVFGCATPSGTPNRPYARATTLIPKCNTAPPTINQNLVTPEIHQNPLYTLHFLEFDDQGWLYPDATNNDLKGNVSPGFQIDCAIADLVHKLDEGDVHSFVFVHGWHHSAKPDDRDVNRFREMLEAEALKEQKSAFPRKVIGFYVGWNGGTSTTPIMKYATFWGRKNAAHHISEGSVREFFSRIKALRNHYNRPKYPRSKNCGKALALIEGLDCPLRTVMIGHSFGAWILYSATSPYILETLAGESDLPRRGELPVTSRERGIADLILLLNPAFEATRYDPVHRAAMRYEPHHYEPPLLVSITSTADSATKNMFPIARFFNTLFQYSAASEAENIAIKNTYGHLDRYITHELAVDPKMFSKSGNSSSYIDAQKNNCDPQSLRDRFFDAAQHNGKLKLNREWRREMCGGLTLKNIGNKDLGPYSIVWNIRTFDDVIPDHNRITEPPLISFIEQIYGDLGRTPKWEIEPKVGA